MYSPAITLVGNLAIGAVLLYGGLRVMDGDIKVGVLATFLLYLERFFDPLQDLSQFYNTFQSAAAALEKISGVLDEPPAVPEPARSRFPVARRRPTAAAAAGRCGSTRSGSATGTSPCCPASTWPSRPGRRVAAGRRDRGRQDHRRPAAGPVLRPGRRAGSCSTGWTCGDLSDAGAARARSS